MNAKKNQIIEMDPRFEEIGHFIPCIAIDKRLKKSHHFNIMDPSLLSQSNGLSCGCSSVVEHHVANVRVVSSNLIIRLFLIDQRPN